MTRSPATIILHHLEGARAGQVERYTQPRIVIGRAPDCHLVYDQEKGVSGHHCEIREVDGEFHLVDNASTNGLFVGDERVSSRVLRSGDLVRFGMMGPLVRVEIPAAVPDATVAIPMQPVAGSTIVMASVDLKPAPGAPATTAPPRPASPPRFEPPRVQAPAGPAARPASAPAGAPAAAAPRGKPAADTRAGANMALRWVLAVLVVVGLGGGAALLAWFVMR